MTEQLKTKLDGIIAEGGYKGAVGLMLREMCNDSENCAKLDGADISAGIEKVMDEMRNEARKNSTGGCGVITPDRAKDIIAGTFLLSANETKTVAVTNSEPVVDVLDMIF